MPRHAKGIHEEQVPGKGDGGVVHAVGVLEVDGRVLDVVARIQKKLSLSVELECLGRLVNLVCSF